MMPFTITLTKVMEVEADDLEQAFEKADAILIAELGTGFKPLEFFDDFSGEAG